MAFGVTFKRYEKKFLLNPEQFLIIKAEIDKYFEPAISSNSDLFTFVCPRVSLSKNSTLYSA